MGDSAPLNTALDEKSLPCPYVDGFEGKGDTYGKAAGEVLEHLVQMHWSQLPEPIKTEINGCAHTLSTLPV